MNSKDFNRISEELLLAVKMQKDTATIRIQLENSSLDKLKSALNDDDKKKTFWINIYNAFFQILRKEQKIDKPDIYKKKLFTIAGESFSLDDVEHGILRRFRYKYSLGLVANIFAPRLIKKLAVDKLDYRIHFALNCGAKSCPPIAFYKKEQINAQLDMATQAFLEGESDFDDENKTLHTTALFQWFAADFGGTKGIKKIYQEQIGKDIADYKIKYKAYSWEEELDNFAYSNDETTFEY